MEGYQPGPKVSRYPLLVPSAFGLGLGTEGLEVESHLKSEILFVTEKEVLQRWTFQSKVIHPDDPSVQQALASQFQGEILVLQEKMAPSFRYTDPLINRLRPQTPSKECSIPFSSPTKQGTFQNGIRLEK